MGLSVVLIHIDVSTACFDFQAFDVRVVEISAKIYCTRIRARSSVVSMELASEVTAAIVAY